MTQNDRDIAYEILDVISEAIMVKPLTVDFPVRVDNTPRLPGQSLSSAGKSSRFLAHMQVGSPKKQGQPRYLLGMDMGTLAHDYIRYILREYEHCELTDAEREVSLVIERDIGSLEGYEQTLVKGHIDGFLEFETVQQQKKRNIKVLLDIKCVNLYTFNELDPRNPETNWWAKSRKWAAGNYIFDSEVAFAGDDFKKPYLDQIACYEQALEEEGESWDVTAFILYCRDTSHIAVGIYGPEMAKREAVVEADKKKMQEILDKPDPKEYAPCWEAAVGSEPYKVCQYCDYLHECFDIKTKVFRGKPRMNILRIH